MTYRPIDFLIQSGFGQKVRSLCFFLHTFRLKQRARLWRTSTRMFMNTFIIFSSTSDQHAASALSLTAADHVASVCRSAFYHLQRIRPTLQSLSPDAAKYWSRCSSIAARTTAIRCCIKALGLPTIFNSTFQFRMLPPG